MITIFDIPKEVRKNIPIKNIQNTLDLVVESLRDKDFSEEEIKELISSEGAWLGLMILSQASYNAEKLKLKSK